MLPYNCSKCSLFFFLHLQYNLRFILFHFLFCLFGFSLFSLVKLVRGLSLLFMLSTKKLLVLLIIFLFPLSRSLFFFFFNGCTCRIWKFWGQGVKADLQLQAYTTAPATQIWATSETTTTCSNAGSLIRWVRPVIEPASSWILFGFLTCWATMGTLSIIFWISILYISSLIFIISFLLLTLGFVCYTLSSSFWW